MFKFIMYIREHKGNLKTTLYLSMIALLYFIITLINFTKAQIDLSLLHDRLYWLNYVITMLCGLAILVITIPYKKEKLLITDKITDKLEELRALKLFMINEGLYDKFKKHLVKRNRERKIAKYKLYLQARRDRAKKSKHIDSYDKILKDIAAYEKYEKGETKFYEGVFDPDKLKIKIKAATVNVIFHGIESKEIADDGLHYTGRENLASTLVGVMLLGVILTSLMLMVGSTFKDGITAQQWILFASKIWVMTVYLNRGLYYGDYSINTVYYSCLENRVSEAMSFIIGQGINIEIKDNETYKYKVAKRRIPEATEEV